MNERRQRHEGHHMPSAFRTASSTIPAAAFVAALAAQPAVAQSPADYYKGKNLSIVIGYSAGGGYDLYARVLGRHIAKHIPGNPAIVPQNMPGAGSLKALEYVNKVAPKDGLTIGTFGRTLPLAPLIEGAKFDASKLEWVGSITDDTSTCVAWHTSPVKKWEDLKTKKFTVGGLGKGSDPEIFAKVLINLFKLDNVKLVSGYRGTNDVALAVERGELDGLCGYSYSAIKSSRKAWLADKKINILSQAALQKDPELPADVPLLLDLLTDAKDKQALTLIIAAQAMARPFAMPPGTPKDRVEAMRAAFMATMKDAEFVAEAKKTGLDINPMPGDKMAELMAKAFATPPEIVALARRATGN
jgi:tripartite-type tricarboxylate transporter receptor subunit TctC